eukprot:1433362-Pleurochrysis_carterae.AAC.1
MHHHVLVYGSLMRGLHNHRLVKNSQLIADMAITVQRDFFVVDTCRGFPFAVSGEYSRPCDTLCPLRGELYLVDSVVLQALDALEGHPSWYCRRKIGLANGLPNAWTYILQSPEEIQAIQLDTSGDIFLPVRDNDWRMHFTNAGGVVEV